MNIIRIDGYEDARFPRGILLQHGAFLAEGTRPCSVEIVGPETAVVRGEARFRGAVIDAFRFYAEHVTRFTDPDGRVIAEFPPVARFDVSIEAIQPSQFYVDRDKLAAVRSFVRAPEDVEVPRAPWGDRYISLDGHTRLVAALALGFPRVEGFVTEAGDWARAFAEEAVRRGVRTPRDIQVLDHGDYDIKWNRYCDAFFGSEAT